MPIQVRILRDGVAAAGLLWLTLYARAIPYANAVKNALVKKFITLYHYIKAAVCLILGTWWRSVKSVITKLQAVILRK